jgi:hypothetical protein
MPNPWLNEHKFTAAMNYFLSNTMVKDKKDKKTNNDLQNSTQKTKG